MAANLDKERRVELRRRAWSLRMRGWTEQRIADDLGVHQGTVSIWLDQLTRKALANLEVRIERELMATLGLLDHTIDEAVQAWDRSKKPKRKASKRTGSTATGQRAGSAEQTTAESTDRDGDPTFLSLVLSASDRKRQLLALDQRFAPPKDADAANRSSGLTVADALALAEARDAEFIPDTAEDADEQPPADEAEASPPVDADAPPADRG